VRQIIWKWSRPATKNVAGFLLIVATFSSTRSLAADPDFAIQWKLISSDTNRFVIEVSGLTTAVAGQLAATNWTAKDWQRLLAVYAEQGNLLADVGLPPMLGAYHVEAQRLRFEPQFPLEVNVKYRVTFDPGRLPGMPASNGKVISETFQLPTPASVSTTVVSHIYPSAAIVPENLLKFYVHFSAPMRRGHIYDYIHLRNEAGKEIQLPFLEIDEELWSPEMTRLTLFIDPGRIKRGVKPLEEVGPALETGKRYALVIDKGWKDANGNSLRESFAKTFQVGPPDREPPNPAQWKIQSPKLGTKERLVVVFSKPMDHALAQRVIRVARPSGELISGSVKLLEEEQRWNFTPAKLWERGTYRVLVQTTIEDLAGNNIGKPFEVDAFEPVQSRFTNTTVSLPFEAR
jgi:hypothetical protein